MRGNRIKNQKNKEEEEEKLKLKKRERIYSVVNKILIIEETMESNNRSFRRLPSNLNYKNIHSIYLSYLKSCHLALSFIFTSSI